MNRLSRAVLEHVYPRINVRCQNTLLSAYGYLYRSRRVGGNFSRTVEAFVEREHWPAERMNQYLQSSLRRLLRHAWDNVPYYRGVWSAAGIDGGMLDTFGLNDLPALPVVRKADLRRYPDSFLARGAARWQRRLSESTSGSTGEPVTVTTTPALQRAYLAAREARSFRWAGSSLLLPRATFGGRALVPGGDSPGPYYRYNHAERQVYLSAFHISPDRARHYVAALCLHRPRVLTGYASSYFSLARMMLEQGLALDYRPDCLVLCADQQTPQMKAVIYQAFRARPYEEYGSVENAVLATECEYGSLHTHPDFGILELANGEGTPVSAGEEGRLLCTSLLNTVQPLIRYELGDLGTWSGSVCACGRSQFPVLSQVVGRIEDTVIGHDGREIVRLCSLQAVPNVLASQIVQERLDALRVLVVPAGGFNAADERKIREILAQRLGRVRIDIEKVAQLEKTAAGKVRRVIRRIARETHVGEHV